MTNREILQNRQIRNLLIQIAELRQRIQELEEEQGEYYVASSRRPKFHRPLCKYAPNSSYLIEFFSHAEAAEAGYKPCGTCKA